MRANVLELFISVINLDNDHRDSQNSSLIYHLDILKQQPLVIKPFKDEYMDNIIHVHKRIEKANKIMFLYLFLLLFKWVANEWINK